MGENSQKIGKKLEGYCENLFPEFGWTSIGKNIEINCSRANHIKETTSGSKKKKTHGIDYLFGYTNPFMNKTEAVIVECKNHAWKDFIPSKLSEWVEELVNTIECAITDPLVSDYLNGHSLNTGVLLFNSSDGEYEYNRARESLSKVNIPRRRNPIMIYIADTAKIEKWESLRSVMNDIKQDIANDNFGIIYPSIGGSSWNCLPLLTPSYLFSDYMFSTYQTKKSNYGDTKLIDVKVVFSFDAVCEEAFLYMRSMVNNFQLEAKNERPQEMHLYIYPQTIKEIEFAKSYFQKKDNNIIVRFLKNRSLSAVELYGGNE